MSCEYPSTRQKISDQASLGLDSQLSLSRNFGEMHTSQSELNEQITALGMTDLRLLHNWTFEAYKGFGDTIKEDSFWQIEVPQLAFTHPSLMHGLLAISCLHLARRSRDRRTHYPTIAAEHQNKALPAYRSIISDLERNRTEQEGLAVVAFTRLTTIYAILSPIATDSQLSKASRAIAHAVESFSLLRGGAKIVAVVGDSSEGCTMTSITRALSDDINLSLNPEDARLALLEPSISRDLGVSPLGADDRSQVISNALYLLRRCFAILYLPSKPVRIVRALKMWVGSIPNTYLEMLRELRSGALVVLARWCIMLKRAETTWYLQGSAENIMSVIAGVLNEEWRARIAWPLQVVYNQGVELPSLGINCHELIFGNGGSLIQDSIGHLAHDSEVAIKGTSAGCP